MINISELQFNDWVEARHIENICVPLSDNEITSERKEEINKFQVRSIRKNAIGYEAWNPWLGRNAIYNEEIEDVFPIPLTIDILKLNGFVEGETFSSGKATIIYDFYEGYNFSIYDDSIELHIVVWNVHELQNLLRLSGLTELADSFKIEEKENGGN